VKPEVIIVGGGITGLSAARILSRRGIPFLLLESQSKLGGRIQSENYDGYILDNGFQIINTAYPEWENQQINLAALSLKSFASGAKIFQFGKIHTLADPFREGPVALEALFSKSVSIKDMFLVLKLRRQLKNMNYQQVFNSNDLTTLQYLRDYGFSGPFIDAFFKPFYAGIFLEPELNTPAAMFAFVFKAFAEGTAALPEKGMQQLIKLISSEIDDACIRTSTRVKQVQSGMVTLEDGSVLSAPHIWVTTGISEFQSVCRTQWKGNHSTTVLYYTSDKAPKWGKFIGLNASENRLVNHFCMPSAIQPEYSPEGKHLLSVTLKPGTTYWEGLEKDAVEELRSIHALEHPINFLKAITVANALPGLSAMNYEPELIQLHHGVLATGDFAAYPSVNAALRAGRLLAETL
jgi:protoporphyrinogen oxidase